MGRQNVTVLISKGKITRKFLVRFRYLSKSIAFPDPLWATQVGFTANEESTVANFHTTARATTRPAAPASSKRHASPSVGERIPLSVQTGHSRQHKLDTSRPTRSEGATARFKVQCRALHLLNFFPEGSRQGSRCWFIRRPRRRQRRNSQSQRRTSAL